MQPLNVCGWAEGADCYSFSDFWLFGAGDPGRSVAVAWAALSGDLERLKDIFESDDRSIFVQRPGVEEGNVPDVLEHWTLCEYVELAFLRAARGSSRRHNLHTVLLWMEGHESTMAFDSAFGPMNEYLDVLRTLTLKGKAFHVFSFQKRINQLRLIKGCYSGQENVLSELLKVGAPAEISPLFCIQDGRRSVGVFLASARSTGGSCFRGGCGPREAILRWRALLRESGNVIVCCRCIILSFFFVHCKCDPWNAFSAKSPDGRSVWRRATRDGELRQTGSKCHGGLSGVFFWRCRLMIGSLSRRVLAGLGSPVRSRTRKTAAALCS